MSVKEDQTTLLLFHQKITVVCIIFYSWVTTNVVCYRICWCIVLGPDPWWEGEWWLSVMERSTLPAQAIYIETFCSQWKLNWGVWFVVSFLWVNSVLAKLIMCIGHWSCVCQVKLSNINQDSGSGLLQC